MDNPITLITQRLTLRPPIMDDAEAIFEGYAQDADVTRWLMWKTHDDIATTRAFLESCEVAWQNRSGFPWVITRNADKVLMGMIDARPGEHGVCVGYVLAKPYWNHGYMTEALSEVIRWAFTHETIYRVWAFCDVENHGSRRVMEKAGMSREGILRKWCVCTNLEPTPRDCYCYASIRSE